jgi:hypothetical protein
VRDHASTKWQIRILKSEIRNNFKCSKTRKFQTNSEGRAANGEEWVSRSRFQVTDFSVSDLELPDFGILFVFVSDFDIRISDFESFMSWHDQWPKSKAQSALRHALSPMRASCKGTGQQR